MTLLFASGIAEQERSKGTIVHDRPVGDLPIGLILDPKIGDGAKICACLLWSQSEIRSDGRRCVTYGVRHVSEVMGVSFNTASSYVKQLREQGYVAKIKIYVPEFSQTIAGYWLAPNAREAVRVRNARDRSAAPRRRSSSNGTGQPVAS